MSLTAKIIIVGSGPAGVAIAASLRRQRPDLKDDILILEKAYHPRPKLCGGGLTPWADEMLTSLGLQVQVPTFRINQVEFYLNRKPIYFNRPGIMRTVRRDEFDAALVARIRERGITVQEGVAVQDIGIDASGVHLETSAGRMRCDILVGADGAKSTVRRLLFQEQESRVSRLMEVVVPVDGAHTPEFLHKRAVVDFRALRRNLQGYLWEFPSWLDGRAHLNIGIFDSRIVDRPRANLAELLGERLARRGIELQHRDFMGHPERWFHPGQSYSRPRVLLVGDAAGIEPWLGEGISIALGYGPVAAHTVATALKDGDFSFTDYTERIKRSSLGWFLKRNRLIANLFYRPQFYPLLPIFGRVLSWHMARKKHERCSDEVVELAVDGSG